MSYSPTNKYIIKELVSSISFIILIGLNLGMLRVAHAGPHPYSEPQIVAQKMNQESLPDFIAYSMKKLQEKADALSTRIFDEFNDPSWNISTENRLMEWIDTSTGEVVLAYTAIPIGTFNKEKGTFLWSWTNSAIPNNVELVKDISALAEKFPDVPLFLSAAPLEVPEQFAIDVTAALVELYEAVSFYRYLSDDGKIVSYFYLKELTD